MALEVVGRRCFFAERVQARSGDVSVVCDVRVIIRKIQTSACSTVNHNEISKEISIAKMYSFFIFCFVLYSDINGTNQSNDVIDDDGVRWGMPTHSIKLTPVGDWQ